MLVVLVCKFVLKYMSNFNIQMGTNTESYNVLCIFNMLNEF